MSNDIKNDLINWNAEQLSDDSPVYNSKDLINALNSIMPSLGSVILTTNNHVLSKQEDWDSITMNTLNMFTTLANSGLPASDFPNNSGILLVLGYTSYNIYIAISGEAVYYRLGGDDWNKLLTSASIRDLTGSVATLTSNLSELSDQQTTLNSLFNTFKDDTNKQLDTLNTESTSQAKMLEDINNQLVKLNETQGSVDNSALTSAPAFVNLQTQVDNSAVGTNLFSQSTATAGYIDSMTGNVDSAGSANEIVSDYISVSASSAYTFQLWGTTPSGNYNWYGIGLYDSNKKFISRPSAGGSTQPTDTTEHVSKTLTTTSATAYVRVSFRKYSDYKAKFEKGSVATPWCPNPSEILTQADYSKIKAGITPTIDDNGHWKIGDTVTQYSAGMKDFDDSATLLDINTDKAQYYPSEKVIFHATSVSGHGHLVIKYYNLNNLIATKDIYYGTSEISWSWILPPTDNVGYSVVINNYVGEDNETSYRFAINVSNDPYNYPIMGFLSKYDIDSPVQRKEVLDYMNRLHINLVQFYDWFDLHSLPLPVSSNGDSAQVSNTWTDIGNRLTRKKVIEEYCNLTKEHAMKPLAYMAMNGSDTNQLIHGLSAEMFLYDDNSKSLDHVYKTLDKSKGWGKYNLYNTNWMNESWQDYIDNQMRIVRDNMPFDGWHIDMFGNPGNKYDSNGNNLLSSTLENGIHYFLNKAGNLGWDIGVNSVGEYGINDIKPVTALKYLYTEVWDNRKTYDDMFKLVRGLTESTDSNKNKKGVIIAAYMDYDYAKNNSGKDFNIDGIILADLVIMASGGTHLEMGEHMLCNEYFPNSNLNLPAQLKSDYLPNIYDFFVAFKEIIGLGHQVDNLATIDSGSVDSLQSGKVCGISCGNDKGYLGLSLINLNTANTDWRDTNATCSVTVAKKVKVTLNQGVTNHDWYYFDLEHLEPQKIDVGAGGIVNISELHYFGFILGVPNK